jgi:aldehyde dehydrogenase (NAD+)
MAVTTAADLKGMIIAGEEVPAAGGGIIEDRNPANGELLATIASAGADDVDRAVRSAADAFGRTWQRTRPAERGRILVRIAAAIRARAEDLARMESLDTGKPLRQARADTEVAARYFEFYGGAADKILGSTIPLGTGFLDYTVREPLGVSAHIVPWNYPLQILGRGVAAALAAGNAVVLKPASQAPLTALAIGRIALECGLPAGVLNVIPGSGADAGSALASHRLVNQITFTGSIETGTQIMKMAADHTIPVTLELGGKSPNIVFADADPAATVDGVANAIYQHAGQTCSAGSRLLLERKAHDSFLEMLTERVGKMTIGPGIDDPDIGPLITEDHRRRVLDYIALGKKEGADVAYGGKAPDDERLSKGSFLQPTLLDRVTNEMRVAQEEIFGPVLVVIPFDEVDEAAAISNDSKYGLLAGIWTRDINKALALAERIQAGQVYINTYGAGGGAELPFGGYKQSGFGREKGLEGLIAYTQVKNVCVRYAPLTSGP